MAKQAWRKGRIILSGMLGVVALAMLTLWGCGGGGGKSYDTPSLNGPAPVATKTATPLVDAVTLKGWLDAGLVNKAAGSERVVILEFSGSYVDTSVTPNVTKLRYNDGHIPGAIRVDLTAELMANRVEGPAEFAQMVASGAQMDALIKRCGIDENTTIVFTTSEAEMNSNTLWNITRPYTTFRYWGFPKERLKVLDGGNKAWVAAAYPMTTVAPTITASTYNVTPLNTNRVKANLRASLSEMIAAVNAGTGLIIDGRTDGVPGSTTDLVESSKYVVFEGRMTGGSGYSHVNLVDATTKKFKDPAVVAADMTTKGLDLTKNTIYAMCRAGNIASALFFYFDGILYNDGSKNVVWYDGSWGQWGLMSDNAAKGGKLPVGSAWATDSLTLPITYDADLGRTVVDITYRLDPTVSHATATANQIEDADKAYLSPVTSGGGGAGGGGGGGC
ncbi:Rhodanese domain protein [Geobacter metallireducens RCH3]|uniref:Rhodanese homology domain pair protein n=1 Tax=Geobacter metallireducens (strain ATCC 53774 / DSM 7210 / GS-15) TaxID=269799 RepID=Q39YA0_GEOMG|nr:selenite/tellurite reduction operon rhodanese-like protein ExtH [Geobacter metallireducens]ABB30774.1 rhodanese homology domain pair protein [Geobacter metallireducens GS-15]EHP88185.1 Rhodanese domain protein [Geobacter metallireducens RCH3]